MTETGEDVDRDEVGRRIGRTLMSDAEGEQQLRPMSQPFYPQAPTAIASAAMDLFGLKTPAAKRRFTRAAVLLMFGVVVAVTVYSTFVRDIDPYRRDACRTLISFCMATMFVLLTLQAIRNNEDSHQANHLLRGDLAPIKSGVELVEKQTNGSMTEKFESLKGSLDDIKARVEHIETQSESPSPRLVSEIAEAAVRAAISKMRDTNGE